MTYLELKKICVELYGNTWQPNLAHDLDIKRTTIKNWSSQGVPKWMQKEMPRLIERRKIQVLKL